VLQVGETCDGTPFVVQKLIEGRNLAEILKLGGPLAPDQAVSILTEVCRSLATAHARAMVHRDLKPGNILVDESGMPWVADFGLAFTEEDVESGRNYQSSVAGTPAYMSPEQLSDCVERLDGRCDIWALGVILYEVLTGKRPFRGSDPVELREQIRHHDPRPISQRQPHLSSQWTPLLCKAAGRSLRQRFGSG
jgi:serine/threonine protein kinase